MRFKDSYNEVMVISHNRNRTRLADIVDDKVHDSQRDTMKLASRLGVGSMSRILWTNIGNRLPANVYAYIY